MRYCPKTLLTTGALLALAGPACLAQSTGGESQDAPTHLPTTTEAPKTAAPGSQGGSGTLAGAAQLSPYSVIGPSRVESPVQAAAPQAGCPASGALPAAGQPGPGPKPCPPALAYRKEYEYPPLGLFLHDNMQTQVNNGIAARMMLYDYDFVCGGTSLNVRGNDRLYQVAQFWKSYDYPLIVERTPYNVALAEGRRAAVLSQFAEMGLNVSPERVLIGAPMANGLRGPEAVLIYRNLLEQTQSRGITRGGQGGGGIGAGLNIGSGLSGTGPQQ
jgi:hypothetical protein